MRACVGLLASFSVGGGLLNASELIVLPYLNDFESADGYSVGALGADLDWRFDTNLDVSVVTDAANGDQSLSFSGAGWLSVDADPAGFVTGYPVTWLDFYLKPVFRAVSELPQLEDAEGVSAGLGFVKIDSHGELRVFDGKAQAWDNPGTSASIDGDQASGWMRLTYRLDYSTKLWDLYVNGALVLPDIGFIDSALNRFEGFSLQGSEQSTGFDAFYAGTDSPLFADTSGDGLPDAWLTAYGLSTAFNQRYGDPDHDGIPNILEYKLGLNPTDFDSDHDGVWDLRELLRGNNPAVPDTYALGAVPFSDGFEADADGSLVSGTRLWQTQAGTGSSVAVVTAADSPEGSRQVVLSGLDASLSRDFANSGQTVVWVDFQLRAQSKSAPPEDLPKDIGAVFYFAEDGTLMVLNGNLQSGGTWQGLRQISDLGTGFHRITLRLDYSAQTWSIWLDDVRRGQNLGFANPVPFFSGFALTQSSSQSIAMDAFSAVLTEPTALDNDGDGLPNTWELAYGLNPENPSDATLSLSGDGWTNAEKYQWGVSPEVSNLSSLPFYEPFEQQAVGSMGQGERNWFYTGDAPQIQTADVDAGAQALSIPASSDGVQLANRIDGAGQSVIWTQLAVKAAPYAATATPELSGDASAGLFFTEDGHPRVYDGSLADWTTLTAVTVDLTQWHTVTLRHDYTTRRWSLWVDGALAAENLGFAHSQPAYAKLSLSGGAEAVTQLDTVRVQTTPPMVVDSSVLPDAWRMQYFGLLSVDPVADADGDGLSNWDEYLQGHIPTISDAATLAVGALLYVDGTVGSDSLYNGYSANPGKPVSGYGPKATLGMALGTASSDARIIMTAGSSAYSEGTINLTGKNIVLRPNGDVHIHGL